MDFAEQLKKSLEEHIENNFPEGVSVPLPGEATEDEAIRAVKKQFKDAGFDCPDKTARGLVQEAWRRAAS